MPKWDAVLDIIGYTYTRSAYPHLHGGSQLTSVCLANFSCFAHTKLNQDPLLMSP